MQTMQLSREATTNFQTNVQLIVQNLFKELDEAFSTKSESKINELCEKIRSLE
jgi:predicted HAD superfamily phosphohydrolase